MIKYDTFLVKLGTVASEDPLELRKEIRAAFEKSPHLAKMYRYMYQIFMNYCRDLKIWPNEDILKTGNHVGII